MDCDHISLDEPPSTCEPSIPRDAGVRQLGCRKGLAVASLNVNSLLLHIDEIKKLMKEKSIHVLALNETKLDDNIASDLLRIDGYTLYREDRTRNGGGVAVYISDSLKHSRRKLWR